MTQQTETRVVVSEKHEHKGQPDAGKQFNMLQSIRAEIVAMLAARKRGFSADDYQRLGREGILHEDDRVELIGGEIVPMSPIGSRHAACVNLLSGKFSRLVGEEYVVAVQNPISLGNDSEPQPDIALLRDRDDMYASAHPTPDDILPLVEVADCSLERDREKAEKTYSKHRIPELWIANLLDEVVERYRSPTPDGYQDVEIFNRGYTISPELLPDVEFPIDDMLL